MDKIRITGGVPLRGTIELSGAKNSALPLMVASLLTDQPLRLSNIPHISDISTMANLLLQHGTSISLDDSIKDLVGSSYSAGVMTLCSDKIKSFESPYDIVRKMRASVLVLGPLLARFGEARVSLPGGCAIGTRPVDLHLKALMQMGADISIEDGYIVAKTERLKGTEIYFDKVSVGATENILMAATLALGTTTLRNAAKEPEIVDLANCLVKMGAKIKGIGTDTLIVEGVDRLNGATHKVISDRIEAGTYIVAAAITKGRLKIKHIDLEIMRSTIDKFLETGMEIKVIDNETIEVSCDEQPKSVNLVTQPYPGFATDLQAQFMALMCVADGTSIITENIFENRFMQAAELIRMGSDITIDGHVAIIKGIPSLSGAQTMATDLRASVSLVLAALIAQGTSIVNRMYHIDRGYERIEEKLAKCGALIERIK